jgi:hypothetical protein
MVMRAGAGVLKDEREKRKGGKGCALPTFILSPVAFNFTLLHEFNAVLTSQTTKKRREHVSIAISGWDGIVLIPL